MPFCCCHEVFEELSENCALDQDALGGDALLSACLEGRCCNPLCGIAHIGVGQNDIGCVRSEFGYEFLCAGKAGECVAAGRPARERHRADERMCDQCARGRTISGEDREEARRPTGFFKQLGELECRTRPCGSRLDDNSVACRNRRSDLLDQKIDRCIERRDAGNDTVGNALCKAEASFARRSAIKGQDVAVQLG
jgi:hypothetical protein